MAGLRRHALLPLLVRYFPTCIAIFLMVSALVASPTTSETHLTSRLKDLMRSQSEVQAHVHQSPASRSIRETNGGGNVPDLPTDRQLRGGGRDSDEGRGSGFNTDVAERRALEVVRHAEQFFPLRLRGGYTGLRATKNSPDLFLAIGILTGPTHRSRKLRDSIRRSWGRAVESVHLGQTVTHRFFAAMPPPTTTAMRTVSFKELEDEATEHRDMIILGHEDSFTTISKKTIAIMTWGSDLSGASFVAKTDDDTFVNIPNAVSWLLRHGNANMFAGISSQNSSVPVVYTPKRHKDDPFYVSHSEFPFDKGGCYLQGAFFVASRDVASHVGALRNQPTYVWNRNEDVMMAMRVREFGGVTTTDDRECFFGMPILSYTLAPSCEVQLRKRTEDGDNEPIVAVHGLKPSMMGQVQQNLEKGDGICQDVKYSRGHTSSRTRRERTFAQWYRNNIEKDSDTDPLFRD